MMNRDENGVAARPRYQVVEEEGELLVWLPGLWLIQWTPTSNLSSVQEAVHVEGFSMILGCTVQLDLYFRDHLWMGRTH